MNTPVLNKTLKSKSCNLSAYRIKAGNGDCLRCVVDDQIYAGERFDGSDVAALSADDASFDFV